METKGYNKAPIIRSFIHGISTCNEETNTVFRRYSIIPPERKTLTLSVRDGDLERLSKVEIYRMVNDFYIIQNNEMTRALNRLAFSVLTETQDQDQKLSKLMSENESLKQKAIEENNSSMEIRLYKRNKKKLKEARRRQRKQNNAERNNVDIPADIQHQQYDGFNHSAIQTLDPTTRRLPWRLYIEERRMNEEVQQVEEQ